MQKVIRRTQLALAQAAKKHAKHLKRQEDVSHVQKKDHEHYIDMMLKGEKKRITSELKEDFRLGPLAPRRGLDELDREQRKGAPQMLMHPPIVLEKDRMKHWNIVPGDRVYLTKGKDKGKTGVIASIDKDANTVTVKGLNMVRIRLPAYFQPSVEQGTATQLMEMWIHHDDVKLVVTVDDPTTGHRRDAVVMTGPETRGDFKYHTYTNVPSWKRYVPGSDIEIPWPESLAEDPQNQPPDTLLEHVYKITYNPNAHLGDLNNPPMPTSVIDELRNKYSIFRTRHSEEYVKTRLAEDEAERARANSKIITPKMELNRKIAREKKLLRKKQRLTDDMLEQIGRAMSESRPVFKGVPAPQETNRLTKGGAVSGNVSGKPKRGGKAVSAETVSTELVTEVVEDHTAVIESAAGVSAAVSTDTTPAHSKQELQTKAEGLIAVVEAAASGTSIPPTTTPTKDTAKAPSGPSPSTAEQSASPSKPESTPKSTSDAPTTQTTTSAAEAPVPAKADTTPVVPPKAAEATATTTKEAPTSNAEASPVSKTEEAKAADDQSSKKDPAGT